MSNQEKVSIKIPIEWLLAIASYGDIRDDSFPAEIKQAAENWLMSNGHCNRLRCFKRQKFNSAWENAKNELLYFKETDETGTENYL